MAAHGVGIAFAIIIFTIIIIIYIGYKYIKAREKATARDMEGNIFARYNPEKDIMEIVRPIDNYMDVLTDNSFAIDVEGNEWPIAGMERVREAPGPPFWAKYKQAMKRFKQL